MVSSPPRVGKRPPRGVSFDKGLSSADAVESGYGAVGKQNTDAVTSAWEHVTRLGIAGRLLLTIAVFGTLGSLLPLFAVGWAAKLGAATESAGAMLTSLNALQASELASSGAQAAALGAGLGGDGTANLLGTELKPCSGLDQGTSTGWTRSRSCAWDPMDTGYHEVRATPTRARGGRENFPPQHPNRRGKRKKSAARIRDSAPGPPATIAPLTPLPPSPPRGAQVCVTMDDEFLKSSAEHDGNDLSSVVSHGEHWCVCAWAWASAVERDPERFEGLTLQCEESNEKLRDVYQAYIEKGEGMTSPSGASYGPTAALDAVNRLCPPATKTEDLTEVFAADQAAKLGRARANAHATLGAPY